MSDFGYGFLPKGKKKKKAKKSYSKTLQRGINATKPKKSNSFRNFYRDNLRPNKNDNWGKSMYDDVYNKRKKKKGRKGSSSSSSPSHSGSGSSGQSGYSSGSSRGSGSHGGGGGRRRGGGGRGKGKGGSAYARQRAAAMVKADTNSQMLALINQARGQRDAKNYANSNANALFSRTKGDLEYLFNEARDFNAAQSAKIDERFGTTRDDLGDLYSQFAGQQDTQVEARRQAAMQELQRLGIQNSGMGSFDADALNSSQRMAADQANAMANLGAMQAGSSEIGALLQGMATGSQNQFTGQAMNTRNQSIADTNQQFQQFMNDILGKTQVIKSQEFNKINDLALQLKKNDPMKRSKKNKRRVLKSYAAQSRRQNQLNRTLGGVR